MNWFQRLIAPEVMEARILPLVIAFGCGVLAVRVAGEHHEARALDVAARAIAVAETYRDACGPLWPPQDIPALPPALVAEIRPAVRP